jgi:hypothetical protein
VKLIQSSEFLALANSGRLRIDVCEHSWEKYGDGSRPQGVSMGSQYRNAELAHGCERVIVL